MKVEQPALFARCFNVFCLQQFAARVDMACLKY
jgi:hypothetical protein